MEKIRNLFTVVALCTVVFALSPNIVSADTFKFRVGSGHPVKGLSHMEVLDNFYLPEVEKRVKERTGHDIKWSKSYAGTLAKLIETTDATKSGLLDIGVINYPHNPSQLFTYGFPFYFPFQTGDAVMATKAVRMTFDRVPWLRENFETALNQKVLAIGANGNYGMGGTSEFMKFEDIDGKKVGAAGPNLKWFQGTGATTITTNMGEAYNAISSGIYDFKVIFPGPYYAFKMAEVGKHFNVINFGSPSALSINMNLKTWNKLPEDVQAIFLEVGDEYEIKSAEASNADDQIGLDGLKAEGVEIHYFPEDEQKKWAEALADYPNEQAKIATERGAPGAEIFRTYVEALKELGYVWPYEYQFD